MPVGRQVHVVRVVHGMKRLWRGVGRVRFVTGIDQAEGLVVALAAAHPVGGVVHVEEGRMLGQRQQRWSDVGLTVVDDGIGFEPMLLAADLRADLLRKAQNHVLGATIDIDIPRTGPEVGEPGAVGPASQVPLPGVASQVAEFAQVVAQVANAFRVAHEIAAWPHLVIGHHAVGVRIQPGKRGHARRRTDGIRTVGAIKERTVAGNPIQVRRANTFHAAGGNCVGVLLIADEQDDVRTLSHLSCPFRCAADLRARDRSAAASTLTLRH